MLIDRRFFLGLCLLLLANEFVSFAVFQSPITATVGFLLLSAVFFGIALLSTDVALLIVLAELVVGGKGYLYALPVGDWTISIRLSFFVILLLVWLAKRRYKKQSFFSSTQPYTAYLLALAAMVAIGLGNALLRGRSPVDIFFDLNAYLYFLMAPVLCTSLENPLQRKRLFNLFFAGVVVIGLKSLVMLGLFTHYGIRTLEPVYRWIRDTGVGEVAHIYGPFYRIFFQSQVFAMLGFLIAFGVLISRLGRNTHDDRGGLFVVAVAGVVGVAISLSRSFWVGGGVALAVSLGILLWQRTSAGRLLRILGATLGIAAFSGVLIAWSLYFPYPFPRPGQGGGEALVQERFSKSQPGITSRTKLLPPLLSHVREHPIVGTGFATPITYNSTDPRVVRSGQANAYTTTAFEWGWLDIAIKLGLLGVLLYLLFLRRLLRDCWERLRHPGEIERTVSFGLLLAIVGLAVTHIFSPYLNHPLGIGMVLLTAALLRAIPKPTP